MRDGVFHRFVHFGISQIESFGLKTGIPSEITRTSRLDDRSFRDATEEHDLRPLGAIVISESATRLRRVILEPGQHPMQALGSDLLEEPLDVRTRHSAESVEAEARVLDDDR